MSIESDRYYVGTGMALKAEPHDLGGSMSPPGPIQPSPQPSPIGYQGPKTPYSPGAGAGGGGVAGLGPGLVRSANSSAASTPITNGGGPSGVAGTPGDTPSGVAPGVRGAAGVASIAGDGPYLATYSGVAVLEMTVDNVAVMRRRGDSSLNATQILKLAGIDKSRRSKLLEREVHTGDHEKVQGGYGKYQGTWVSFARGVDLARQYGVEALMRPLLEYNVQGPDTPTKEEAMARKRSMNAGQGSGPARSVDSRHSSTDTATTGTTGATGLTTFSHPLQVEDDSTPLAANAAAALSTLGKRPAAREDTLEDPYPKRMHVYKQGSAGPSQGNDGAHSGHGDHGDNGNVGNGGTGDSASGGNGNGVAEFPDLVVPLDPLDVTQVDINATHLITRLFLQKNDQGAPNDPVSLLSSMDDAELRPIVDVPIDDTGHSALHWASALAMIPLVRELIARGANPQRANYAGESALVRAVLVTNSFDAGAFPQLLDFLYPAITLTDKQGRTVLHHIALTAGIKGRSSASKFYLECLLEWIVRKGSKGSGQYGLDRFMREVVNAQDKNGDTALNVAARVGNKSIAQQLLDVGAGATIPNRAGLRPIDFGIIMSDDTSADPANSGAGTAAATANNANPAAAVTPAATTAPSNHVLPVSDAPRSNQAMVQAVVASSLGAENGQTVVQQAAQQRKEALETIKTLIDGLERDFDSEIQVKQVKISEVHAELRTATGQLSDHRERLDSMKQSNDRLIELDRSSINLERAINEEDRQFRERCGNMSQLIDFEGNFDADQPFRLPIDGLQVHQLQTHQIDPSILPQAPILRARIAAYKRNQHNLEQLSDQLRGRSAALETKFRKVVSLCTGVEESRVDTLLEGLVQAVQSDRDDVDVTRVAGFLRKVE